MGAHDFFPYGLLASHSRVYILFGLLNIGEFRKNFHAIKLKLKFNNSIYKHFVPKHFFPWYFFFP